MNNHGELFVKFAKIVNILGSRSERGAADNFAKLTAPSENKPGSFMFCESNTWRLLSVLARNKNSSKLSQISAIKQWVSEIPEDDDLLELILEDEEIENQVQSMFKRKASDENTQPNKKRLVEISNNNGRTTFKQQFITTEEKKRYTKNSFRNFAVTILHLLTSKPIVKCPTTISTTFTVNIKQRALDGTANEIIKRERDVWRETVKHELHENSVGKYRIALYEVLAGDAENMYNTVCDTWEDVVWAYLNKKVEAILDEPGNSNNDPIIPADVVTAASAKDRIMYSEDPRIIFHRIQAAILSDTTEELFKEIYLALYQKENYTGSRTLKISDEIYFRSHLLRFVSTLIIYGKEYLGWKETKYSIPLLSAYIDLNGQDDLFNPVVIASYTAKQSPENQIQMYSNFLQNFAGDDEEKSILIQLGKEYGLDMPDILQYTFTQLFEKAIANANAPILAKFTQFETTGEITNEDEPFFTAVKWLIYDTLNFQQAIKAVNMVMRYFLATYKIHLVPKVYEIVPEMLLSQLSMAGKVDDAAATIWQQFQLNASLARAIILYEEIKSSFKEEPIDDGSYSCLLKIIHWKDNLEKKCIDFSSLVRHFLAENWLEKDEDDFEAITNDRLKEVFMPQIIIMYHQALVQTRKIIPSNVKAAKDLAAYITEKRDSLLKIIKNANRAADVLEELSSSVSLS